MRSGLTLLEAVVSLAILSLVGVAAMGAVGRDLDATVRARVALEAAALAQDRLETIRLVDPGMLTGLPDSLASGRFAAPFDAFRWDVAVKPMGRSRGLYDVTVTILWVEGRRSYHARLYRPMDGGSPAPVAVERTGTKPAEHKGA